MSGNRVAECLQIIAAFEQGDDTAAGATVGQIHDLLRGPDEVGFGEVDVGEWVAHMRVKAGRDDHKLRSKFSKPRQNSRLERRAERCTAISRTQRRVDDRIVFAGFANGAGPRKQRHLMGRAIHDGFIRPEDLLRTVAVMHVEINDGCAGEAVALLLVTGGDRGIVEQAKTHLTRGFGVVAGRSCRNEGVGGFFGQYLVDRMNCPAGRPQSSLEGAG